MIADNTRIELLASAMLRGYAARYQSEDFEVEALEREFCVPIRNPETGAESRTFKLAGKVDGLVRRAGKLWLVEHKTAAAVDGSYIERLWMDFQTVLYSWAIEQEGGEPVEGVLYNVVAKAALRPYEANKTRKECETPGEFAARLADWYAKPGAFHREELLISPARFDSLKAELWELTQALLDAKRRDVWYQNPSQCFQWGHACGYWPICRSCDNPNVVDNDYHHEAPHSELEPTEEPTGNGNGKRRTTYSMWSSFRDCRRRYYWRHEKQIVPNGPTDEKLFLGSVVHEALAKWHATRDLTETLGVIGAAVNGATDKPLAF